MRSLILTTLLFLISSAVRSQDVTYAEKLGFPKGSKVLIMHVDDVGMSWDSNQGAIQAMEKGVANSVSIMMSCPWVPGFSHYLKDHPGVDAGLHLTLTSEWKDYRWAPLSGKTKTPGLVDPEGAMWPTVEDVAIHSTPDEVEAEILAQLDRARTMGITPTHLDTHMGTVFATPEFLQRYIRVGIENKIPVMFFGGHMTSIRQQEKIVEDQVPQLREAGKMIWDAGLPVLDDLHNLSYGFDYPQDENLSDKALRKFATSKYIETIGKLRPGLTMVIMHCTDPSEIFRFISESGRIRKGDLLAMTDPKLKEFLQKEKIILTTWRELMERRSKVK